MPPKRGQKAPANAGAFWRATSSRAGQARAIGRLRCKRSHRELGWTVRRALKASNYFWYDKCPRNARIPVNLRQTGRPMKKPPRREGAPDPMASVVDRLLAQLPGLQSDQPLARGNRPRPPETRGGVVSFTVPARLDISASQIIATWARVLLALTFGLVLAKWPYSQVCGLPLLAYLAAVAVFILGAGAGAAAAWRTRTALAHVVALVLMFYGAALTMAELLPRTGYAVRHATWQCSGTSDSPFWVTASRR